MGIIASVVLFVLGIVGAVISHLLADDFKEWVPWIVSMLIQRSVARMPEDSQERCDEEWRSHVNEIPGQIGKLIFAFDLLSIPRQLHSNKFSFPAIITRLWGNPSFRFCLISTGFFVGVVWALFAGWNVFFPLFLVAVAAAGFIRSFRQNRSLRSPVVYLAYIALSSLVIRTTLAVPHSERVYAYVYWTIELSGGLWLWVMSFETIWSLLPRSFVKKWGIVCLTVYGEIVGITYETGRLDFHTTQEALTWRYGMIGVILCMLLAPLLFKKVKWQKEQALVIAGILSIVPGNLIPWILLLWLPIKYRPFMEQALGGFSYLVTILLFSIAGASRVKENPTPQRVVE